MPRFETGASGVALQCTNHYTNRAITILFYKLRYINKHCFDNSAADLFFKKKLVFQQRQHEIFEQINLSKTETCLFTLQYTKSYGCAVLFLQDILLFDLTFLKFMTLRKTQMKNIAKTCFDTVKHFVVLYILH